MIEITNSRPTYDLEEKTFQFAGKKTFPAILEKLK